MKVRVGFTPGEEISAPVGVVIDVLRATSVICQALAGGFGRVICVGEVDQALALAGPGVVLGGERANVRPEGFDFGNSPREYVAVDGDGRTLVLTTTNGTRLLLAAAARCEQVFVGSLLNLDAVVAAVRATGADEVAVLSAGVEGAFAIDDVYVAGRIAAGIGGDPHESASAAIRLANTFATAEDGIGGGSSAANIRRVGLTEDIPYCAQESLLDIAPRIVEQSGSSVTISAA
ncbi:MAG TPA: 2-phosphosulfolactate phosphatase [Gaiellaceae bacterium]|nr:2-phosphosulfolactate phosphatase [Gaiellaceae bacterium]